MIKILLAVAVLGSMGSFAGLAMAQGKQGEAFGSDVSYLAKLESQCTHRRRTMPPDPRDDCGILNRLRSDAQIGSGQGGAPASNSSQAPGAGPGNGPGNVGNQGNGTGPGSGGGQGKGRR
jgi:hypothetical protein